jgi:hypothetical protein
MTTSFDSTSCLAPEQERNDESETGCGSSDPSSGLADTKLGVPLGVGGEPIASQQLTDVERLRMLGYDATLGRPLGFWSSAAMNLCHMSFVYEFIALAGVLAYKGPLLFVS